MKALRAAAVLLLFTGPLWAQTPAEVHSWLEEVDARRNAFDEAVISARATQLTGGQAQGTANLEGSGSSDQGCHGLNRHMAARTDHNRPSRLTCGL